MVQEIRERMCGDEVGVDRQGLYSFVFCAGEAVCACVRGGRGERGRDMLV